MICGLVLFFCGHKGRRPNTEVLFLTGHVNHIDHLPEVPVAELGRGTPVSCQPQPPVLSIVLIYSAIFFQTTGFITLILPSCSPPRPRQPLHFSPRLLILSCINIVLLSTQSSSVYQRKRTSSESIRYIPIKPWQHPRTSCPKAGPLNHHLLPGMQESSSTFLPS